MAALNDAQREWLEFLGVDMALAEAPASNSAGRARGKETTAPEAVAATAETASAASAPDAALAANPASATEAAGDAPLAEPPGAENWSAPEPVSLGFPPRKLDVPGLDLGKFLDQQKKDEEAALKELERIKKELTKVGPFVQGIIDGRQARDHVSIVKMVRNQFPEMADLSKWLNDTSRRLPNLRGKLLPPTALMDAVNAAIPRGTEIGWTASSGRDMASVAAERLLAGYMAQLPAGVDINIAGGVVKLSSKGAALKVKTPAGEADATADKEGAQLSLKHKDYSIQVLNDGWKEFDPTLRGQWQQISDQASSVLTLKADRDAAHLKWESEEKKEKGGKLAVEAKADFDKREAEFNLAWSKLQEKLDITAKASEEKITAAVTYLKKDKNDKDAVKAGGEIEVDFKTMQAKLKAYYASPSVEAVLQVAASAESVTAKLEVKALKSGTIVTTSFEKSLDEIKAAIDVKLGKTTVGVQLAKKAEELTAKLKLVHETKDLKLAAEIEKTLKDVRGSLEMEVKKGNVAAKVGVKGGSDGKVGGKAQIDIALDGGRSFYGKSSALSFAVDVSNQGYAMEVEFSLGKPVDTASVQDLFSATDRQVQELYKLAADSDIRSLQDIEAVNKKMQEVMTSVNDAAKSAKALKKSEIGVSFGFKLEGTWPDGNAPGALAGTFGVKISF